MSISTCAWFWPQHSVAHYENFLALCNCCLTVVKCSCRSFKSFAIWLSWLAVEHPVTYTCRRFIFIVFIYWQFRHLRHFTCNCLYRCWQYTRDDRHWGQWSQILASYDSVTWGYGQYFHNWWKCAVDWVVICYYRIIKLKLMHCQSIYQH